MDKLTLDAIKAMPFRGYDAIYEGNATEIAKIVEQFNEEDHYEFIGLEVAKGETIVWNDAKLQRSLAMCQQAWDHLEPLFVGYNLNKDDRSLEALVFHAEDWNFHFGVFPEADILETGKNFHYVDPNSFAYYDDAISHRTYRLAYLAQALAQVDHPKAEKILSMFLVHVNYLLSEMKLTARHNHGITQLACAMSGLARFYKLRTNDFDLFDVLGLEGLFWQARRQLSSVIKNLIGEDGCLLEHSVHYQFRVTKILRHLVDENIETDPWIVSLVDRMSDVCASMIHPQGGMINIGDTHFHASLPFEPKNRSGIESQVYPDGGYWFLRSDGAYVTQTAAFHSRFHKQADTGSVTWFDSGKDILIDSGRYGYVGRTQQQSPLAMDGFWYSDPARIHVESTRAHNTIEVDNLNQKRHRQPVIGSSLTGVIENNGVFVSRSTVPNAGRMQHQRFVAVLPGKWMLFLDTCRFAEGEHDLRQWFHLHPSWSKEAAEAETVYVNDRDRLQVLPLIGSAKIEKAYRGENITPVNELDAGLRGWWSPSAEKLEPCESFSTISRGPFVTLATLLTLEAVETKTAHSNVNASQRGFIFKWLSEQASYDLRITSEGLQRSEFNVAFKANFK